MVKGSDDTDKVASQLVMIDDMFGSMSVDDRKVNEWVSMLDIMQRVVKERKGKLRVICTSRTYVFKDVKSKIERFTCFQESKIVDLICEKHALTQEEKLQIWTNYTNEYNVTSNLPDCIFYSVISPHGFPHCVELFCSNQFLRQEGLSFFNNPMKYVCREIQNFKDNDKIKYCILLLILFKNNKLEMNYLQEVVLSDPPKDVIKIFKAAGLSSDHAQFELKKALESLKNTYISEDLDETFRFSHESIRENVAFMCIKDNPLHAIEDIDFRYLVDHTKCYGYPSPCPESVLVLPLFCTNALVERTVREIKAGQIMPVCQHQAWTDNWFVEKWIAYVLKMSQNEEKEIEKETESFRDIFCKLNKCHNVFQRCDLNLIEVLLYLRHEQALLRILSHGEIVKRFTSGQMKQMLSRALVCACFIFPSESFIKMLIKAGADVSIILAHTEVYHYSRHVQLRNLHLLSELYNPVLCSVVRNNRSLMKLLLDYGGRIYIADEPIALIVAVQLGLKGIVEELVQMQGACYPLTYQPNHSHLNKLNEESEPVTAVWNCSFMRYVSKLEFECILSLVHLAQDKAVIEILLKNGVRVNKDVLTPRGRMPHCIYRLLTGSSISVVLELLQAGMTVTGAGGGYSCLHCLMEYINLCQIDLLSRPVYPICFQQPILDIQFQPNKFFSSFILSCFRNNTVNTVDDLGCSPLHYLVQIQQQKVFFSIWEIIHVVFELMLFYGADVNLPDANGITPTMAALKCCGDPRIVVTCVEKRNPKLVDRKGRGYFHYLSSSMLPIESLRVVVKLLLEAGEDINLPDDDENVPVFECNITTLNVFIYAGACLDHRNRAGQNILSYSLQRKDSYTGLQIVESLRNLSKFDIVDTTGRTPMHYLMMSETDGFYRFSRIFEMLLSWNYNPEIPDNNGITPLMLAAENKFFNEIFFAFFLEQGMGINATDTNNLSVLHHCIKSETDTCTKLSVIRILLTSSNDLVKRGRNALYYAVKESSCDFEIIRELFKYRGNNVPEDSKIILGLLSSNRHLDEKIELLIAILSTELVQLTTTDIVESSQINTDMKGKVLSRLLQIEFIRPHDMIMGKDGNTILPVIANLGEDVALCVLTEINNSPRFKSVLSDIHLYSFICKPSYTNCLKYILTYADKLDQLDKNGNTFLHITIENINDDELLLALLQLLMKRKANMYQTDKEMRNPLHTACKKSHFQPQAIHMLMESLTNVDEADSYGMTALQYLCASCNKTNVDCSNQFDVPLYLAVCLISRGADVDHQNDRGQTSIMLAAHGHVLHKDLLSVLIENSRNVNLADANGNTALHRILRSSTHDDVKASLINILLAKGADVALRNNDGQTCQYLVQNQIKHKYIGLHVFEMFMQTEAVASVKDIEDILFIHISVVNTPTALQSIRNIILNKNIDINIRRDSDASTMLMVACESLLPDTTRLLLSLTADPNVPDMLGRTCLTKLATSLTLTFMSILHVCCIGGDLRRETALHLLSTLWNPFDSGQLCKTVADSEFRYPAGSETGYALISHINNAALDILKALLSNGADPNLTDITGKTALHYFVESPISDLFICPAIKMLLEHGANVNSKDLEGMTPLMACSLIPGNKSKRMMILMSAGANILETDNFGCDAVEYGKMAFGRIRTINEN